VPRVQVLLPLPSKNGLNTAFKPFFGIQICTERGLSDRYFYLIFCQNALSGVNNSNVSVCYIINIASNYYKILKLNKNINLFNLACSVEKIDIQNFFLGVIHLSSMHK
jgi:hypothetical protein